MKILQVIVFLLLCLVAGAVGFLVVGLLLFLVNNMWHVLTGLQW